MVPGISCRHATEDVRLGTAARYQGHHGLLLPIFVHCVDDQGRPLLGSTRKGPEGKAFLRQTYTDIPAVLEAMRQYWMPIRYRREA
jgi:hypothetical protein